MQSIQETRPTPQSLPKLIIPSGRYKPEPEEITTRRVESFLAYCVKHKKAPLTRLPSIPLIPPPPSSDSESDTDGTKDETKNEDSQDIEKGVADLKIDNPPDTLAFTENEWEVLEARRTEYQHAKAEHTEAILEMQADPRDRKTMLRARHWRKIRERINLEIAAYKIGER
ncbi:uncharacterized protein GGS22DRAFT_186989 [Annulohypoxylon maeteangense]|uniref:uncharacterized protein n=1 Tax=Annulohypoxylon maeteangense TaxID=1927788 RepID=UPI002008D8E4|nr:uncharacterized protein GGS22DRAFT_186989 [Annulohypoxylon maeteangense]KAI0886909.1 hypothetical protein GGS22DRAFT_186989 [Annulohypoxylon maeteangense]